MVFSRVFMPGRRRNLFFSRHFLPLLNKLTKLNNTFLVHYPSSYILSIIQGILTEPSNRSFKRFEKYVKCSGYCGIFLVLCKTTLDFNEIYSWLCQTEVGANTQTPLNNVELFISNYLIHISTCTILRF